MSFYWKLKKVDYYWAAIELKDRLPELKNADTEMIADNLRGSKLNFYSRSEKKTPFWIRVTLPFAVICLLLLFLFMPINYFITGEWGYELEFFANWMRKLGF